MEKKKYTAKYFRENFPEWKKKKDSVLVRYIFRPISFYTASIAANMGVGANDVSYFSMLIAAIGSCLYLLGNTWSNIVGALLILFWMVLDCTDGNLARNVKKEPFGEFADGASSYLLINFLFTALGVAAYKNTGLIIQQNTWWILVLGAFGGGCDSLSRLMYQKFENNKREQYGNEKKEESSREHPGFLVKAHDRVDKELGLNGIFLPAIFVCSIVRWFDIFVIFYSAFYIASLFATILLLIRKAKQASTVENRTI